LGRAKGVVHCIWKSPVASMGRDFQTSNEKKRSSGYDEMMLGGQRLNYWTTSKKTKNKGEVPIDKLPINHCFLAVVKKNRSNRRVLGNCREREGKTEPFTQRPKLTKGGKEVQELEQMTKNEP